MTVKILALVSFVVTVYVNYLAAAVGINGQLTGAISDKYPPLFTPAGYVFSIWSLIYLGLFAFLLYLLKSKKVSLKIINLFSLTNILNAVWMICWHFEAMGLSVLIMTGLLLTLILINEETYKTNMKKWSDIWFIKLPFQIYLGWISVAIIANVSVYLYSIDWNGWGISNVSWTMIVTVVAVLLAMKRLISRNDVIFSLVLIWALWGIRVKLIGLTSMLTKIQVKEVTELLYYEVMALGLVIVLFLGRNVLKRNK